MNLYSISADLPFLESFASSLLEQTASSPETLSDYLIYLPTRRACKKLQEKFLQLTKGQPILLPEMHPLGDMDEEELFFQSQTDFTPALNLYPAISKDERIIQLAALIRKRPDIPRTDIAIQLSKELGRFLDEAIIEQVDLDALENLVPDDYAEHWQKTLKFLEIVTLFWPQILQEQGAVDGVTRRNLLLKAQADLWRQEPPRKKIICAGVTGSIPMVAELMTVIAEMPNGAVILPALERELTQEDWELIDETHPQYIYRKFLNRLSIAASDIKDWPVSSNYKNQYQKNERRNFISELMRPAALTEKWRDLSQDIFTEQALKGLHYINSETSEEEARIISIIMRETLETPEKTAALITPDRQLASRVKAIMKRWNIEVNDSAGTPLRATAVGTYLRLVAQTIAQNFPPVKMLELLKHPLCSAGMARNDFIIATRHLEKFLLRGPRPKPGLEGLLELLELKISEEDPHNKQEALTDDHVIAIKNLLSNLQEAASTFGQRTENNKSLRRWLIQHGKVAEALAATPDHTGAERLWRQEDGETSAKLFANLIELTDVLDEISLSEYPSIFESLIAGQTVRPKFGMHPRLFILGPLEARLLHHDVTILGSFNEGVWPQQIVSDSWMSRPMRQKFGLPAPEQAIGIMAHDLSQFLCAENVWITRSQRVDGTPQVPSRWFLRLQTILEAANLTDAFKPNIYYLTLAALIDKPSEFTPVSRPAPNPPISARPNKLSVTRIETWKRDPYSIYASQILKLYKLDPIDAQAGVSEKGQFIHDALEKFVKNYDQILPEARYATLLDYGRNEFGEWLQQPEIRGFWWPRFERIADYFVKWEENRRLYAKPLFLESKGMIDIPVDGMAFKLHGRVDRIDLLTDANVAEIIDYKTGSVPSKKEVIHGISPQLPLEAIILNKNGFEGQKQKLSVGALTYLQLTGARIAAKEIKIEDSPKQDLYLDDLITETYDGLVRLIREFRQPDSCYLSLPNPKLAPRYNDYKHLARVSEWINKQ